LSLFQSNIKVIFFWHLLKENKKRNDFYFEGLFEIFSSTSKKAGGILDHEKDVISFASRLKKSSAYYVAKEMKVYEIMVEKKFSLFSSNSKKSYYRKWTHFSPGAICKAIKVVSIDHVGHDQMENNYLCKLNEFFCCMLGGTKKKSDIAIEFKLIENINDMNLAEQTDTFMQDQEVRLKKSKSFYLPVYEENMNKEIDLIPISQLKTNKLETNSLQTINSLIQNGSLKDNCLDLKLFDENPFFKQHFDSNVSEKFGEMVRLNQHLELDKYMSIFELVEIKTKCKIVVGYMLETENLFFTPVESLSAINELKNEINFYSKMNQDQVRNSELINKFQQNELKRFHRIAQNEVKEFNQNLNKLELFALNNKIVNKTELFKPKLQCNQSINHFADFIYLDFLNKLSSNSVKTERKNKLIDQLKSTTKSSKWDKYHTLPNKVSNHLIINGINNQNKNELKQILDVVELYKANSNHEVIEENKKEKDYLESSSHIELKSVSVSSQEVQLRRFKSLPHNNHQRKQNK